MTKVKLVPEGTYLSRISEAEVKANFARTGFFLELLFLLLEAPAYHRRLVSRLNFQHPSEDTMEWARNELWLIADAIGCPNPTFDPTLFRNQRLRITVKHRKDRAGRLVASIVDYEPALSPDQANIYDLEKARKVQESDT